ncbi:MAG: phosphatidate cytidylyltransferase [Candidatus Aureabacteria bacterium]|nr:phosphatidate cytidylyltransferase [Candidatus Auribacterota bacterium]
MLFKRAVSGSVLACLILLVIGLSHSPSLSFLFPLTFTIIAVMGILEFFHLMEKKGVKTMKAFGAFASIVYIWHLYWCSYVIKSPDFGRDSFALFCLFAGFFLVYFLNIYSKQDNSALLDISVSFMGFFYIVWMLSFVIKINYFPGVDGRKFLLLLIVTTKATDIFAYFSGKTVGNIRLCPRISPNKTVEGALGGFAGAIIASVVFKSFFLQSLNIRHAVIAGILIGIIGQLGDLAESLLKRDADVKDSSQRLPGLGGILDVLDSIFFTAPVMYFFMEAII